MKKLRRSDTFIAPGATRGKKNVIIPCFGGIFACICKNHAFMSVPKRQEQNHVDFNPRDRSPN